ncbi:protein of unknown function [Shewanella benthica]|uniref:Uncharacterized protein n=1 Tax=Shewanella benthica TaxID=43661 RepID=A0A330LXB6_9GAMM|nr:protein of unknown function [Shewanella benthica]
MGVYLRTFLSLVSGIENRLRAKSGKGDKREGKSFIGRNYGRLGLGVYLRTFLSLVSGIENRLRAKSGKGDKREVVTY